MFHSFIDHVFHELVSCGPVSLFKINPKLFFFVKCMKGFHLIVQTNQSVKIHCSDFAQISEKCINIFL